jgi:hypothetical protein
MQPLASSSTLYASSQSRIVTVTILT